jgi:hypothetical protein
MGRVTGTLITIYNEIEAETALISSSLRPFIAARVNFNINLTCCAWRQDHRNHSDSSSSSKILGTYHLHSDLPLPNGLSSWPFLLSSCLV